MRGMGRGNRTCILLIIEKYINNLSGTDGFRLRCHQFSPSSLLLPANCISGCNTFWQKMKLLREATLLLSSTDVQGRKTQTMVFPLNTGRWSFTVLWSRRNPFAQWQPRMVSRMKRSIASFVLLRKSIDSKRRNGPACRDGYARRVFLLYSRTDPLHSQYGGY